MKFRHKSNFIPLDLNQVLYKLITDSVYLQDKTDRVTLAQLLACIMSGERVEYVLERYDYVKYDETNWAI